MMTIPYETGDLYVDMKNHHKSSNLHIRIYHSSKFSRLGAKLETVTTYLLLLISSK